MRMIRDTKGIVIATKGPVNHIESARRGHEDDPGTLAEMLLPVLPVLQKHMACWPDRVVQADGPPTMSQMRAIAWLAEHDAVPMRQLATALQLSPPATSELVDRLVERNAVTRQPNPRDRRQVMIALTPSKREAFGHIREQRLRRLTAVVARLAPDERQGFVRGMMLLAEDLASATHPCPNAGTEPTSSDTL